jgi:hypothetical protein
VTANFELFVKTIYPITCVRLPSALVMSDPIRNVIMEKINRRSKNHDETDSAFENIALTENERRPFGIKNQRKERLLDMYKSDLARRDVNENVRQRKYDVAAKRTPSFTLKINFIEKESNTFRITKKIPVRSNSNAAFLGTGTTANPNA